MAGRPTKYKEEYNSQAEKLGRLGLTDEEVAKFFEVNTDTINEWKKVHPEFSVSLNRGKTESDANVADRLYNRAMGFEHPAVKILQYEGEPVIVDYIEKYPPDTTACIFWLKNRQSAKWRDKQEIQQDSTIRVVEEYGDNSFTAPSRQAKTDH